MNNLFKKGFASLALASAMVSSVFAGNAAYLDVKVNYLNTKGNTVLLGGTDNVSERVELYITVLDKDGEYATKDSKGDALVVPKVLRGSGLSDIIQVQNSGNTQALARALTEDKNIARLLLDYSDGNSSNLSDSLIVKAGNISQNITINFSALDAKGLIVRATTKGSLDTAAKKGEILHERFSNITVSGDSNLNLQSSIAPGGAAGVTIPLKVYASALAPTVGSSTTVSADANFTFAPNLEGSTIIVQAVGDYDSAGLATVLLNSVELSPMKDGVATGQITITNSLPIGNDNGDFESALQGGLGVVFVAYVKGDASIANVSGLNLTTSSTFQTMNGSNANTDSVKIKSLDASAIKVGAFNTGTGKWGSEATTFAVVDANGSTGAYGASVAYPVSNGAVFKTFTITAVDSFGNPATANNGKNGIVANTLTFNGAIATGDKSAYFDYNVTDMNDTSVENAISIAKVSVIDSQDKNGSATQTLTINYSNNELSSVEPIEVTVTTIPLIDSKVSGNVILKGYIEATTVLSALKLAKSADTTADGFSIIVTGRQITDSNNTLIQIPDLERDGDFLGVADYTIEQNGSALTYSTTLNGWEVNVSNSTDNNYTIEFKDTKDSTTVVARLTFDANYKADKVATNSVTIDFKALDQTHIPAYYSATFKNERDEYKLSVGDTIDFVFSGSAVNVGDSVTIDFNGTGVADGTTDSGIKVGLAGDAYKLTLTDELTTILPENKTISVALYDVNETANAVLLTSATTSGIATYGIGSVKINGDMVVSSLNARDDAKDTRGTVEFDDTKTVEVSALKIAGATKLALSRLPAESPHTSAETLATHKDYGANDRNIIVITAPSTKNTIASGAVTIGVEVNTNTYYRLFDENFDLNLTDAYGNQIVLRDASIDRNYVLTATDKATVDINRGADDASPAYVVFSTEAAGTTQIVTITSAENDAVSQTITFTNIKKSIQNTKFDITVDAANTKFNVINSEIVVKIKGDGNKAQDKVTLKFTNATEGATVRVVNATGTADFYSTIVDGGITIDAVNADGNYYIISTNKPGTITITANAKITRDNSNTNAEVLLTGSASFTFENVDLNAPMVTGANVITGAGSISVNIQDDNLDSIATTVKIYTVNDTFVKDASYTNGKYVASGLSEGTYSVRIMAVDLAGNTANYSFVRNIGEGGVATLESSLVYNGAYTVAGTFSSHDFADVDSAFDWVYTDAAGTVYQLLGNASSDDDVFGWKEVTGVTPAASDWSMVKLTGALSGKFGWVLVNSDGLAYKLSGVSADGTFKFSDRLYVDGDITGSTVTFTAK